MCFNSRGTTRNGAAKAKQRNVISISVNRFFGMLYHQYRPSASRIKAWANPFFWNTTTNYIFRPMFAQFVVDFAFKKNNAFNGPNTERNVPINESFLGLAHRGAHFKCQSVTDFESFICVTPIVGVNWLTLKPCSSSSSSKRYRNEARVEQIAVIRIETLECDEAIHARAHSMNIHRRNDNDEGKRKQFKAINVDIHSSNGPSIRWICFGYCIRDAAERASCTKTHKLAT